jgi:hypothetical protein
MPNLVRMGFAIIGLDIIWFYLILWWLDFRTFCRKYSNLAGHHVWGRDGLISLLWSYAMCHHPMLPKFYKYTWNANSHEMQMYLDIYLSNDDTHVPWRTRVTPSIRSKRVYLILTIHSLINRTKVEGWKNLSSTHKPTAKREKCEICVVQGLECVLGSTLVSFQLLVSLILWFRFRFH